MKSNCQVAKSKFFSTHTAATSSTTVKDILTIFDFILPSPCS